MQNVNVDNNSVLPTKSSPNKCSCKFETFFRASMKTLPNTEISGHDYCKSDRFHQECISMYLNTLPPKSVCPRGPEQFVRTHSEC